MERKTLAGTMGLARWLIIVAGTCLVGCETLFLVDWNEFQAAPNSAAGGMASGSTGSMGSGSSSSGSGSSSSGFAGAGGAGGGCQGIGGSVSPAPSCAGGGGGLNNCIGQIRDCCDSPSVPNGTDDAGCATICGFYLDAFEVTVGRFKAAVDAGKVSLDPALVDCGMEISTWRLSVGDGKMNMGDGNMNRPINCVTWAEANAFCKWDGGRLPTLGEYRRAARGKENYVYPWGDGTMSPDSTHAIFGKSEPWPVGFASAGHTDFNQYDLAGNVGEWTASDCDATAMAPSGQQATFGGSFKSSDFQLRIDAARVDQLPGTRSEETGFRCARDHE